ncbi:hypothetical protein AKO1_009038 [Acrasis kona]|uniref:Protein YIPF n=1 Tax=Acrasis kona TaxID=1008807 RepID=A0AAW2ZIW9_9EUKA
MSNNINRKSVLSFGNDRASPIHEFQRNNSFDDFSAPGIMNNNNMGQNQPSGGIFGSVMGMIGGGSANSAPINKPVAPTSYEPVVDEVPLLEVELGINFKDVWKKSMFVLNPFSRIRRLSSQVSRSGGNETPELRHILDDMDLAGPLLFCLALGFVLLLRGKLHFGYIYGVGTVGCIGVYLLLNLMCGEKRNIEIQHTISILGYGLLPMVFLAAMTTLLPVVIATQAWSWISFISTWVAVLWSTWSASAMFVAHLHMHKQRWLLTYPVLLVYATFALITVF